MTWRDEVAKIRAILKWRSRLMLVAIAIILIWLMSLAPQPFLLFGARSVHHVTGTLEGTKVTYHPKTSWVALVRVDGQTHEMAMNVWIGAKQEGDPVCVSAAKGLIFGRLRYEIVQDDACR